MARTTTTPTRTAAVVGRRRRRRPEWLTRRGLPGHRDRALLIRVHRRTRTPEQVVFVVVGELVDFFSVFFVFFVRLFEPFRRR